MFYPVVLYVHTWLLCRFVLANLTGQCRRKTILEHFEESTANVLTTGMCCDVCQHDGIGSSNACVHMEIVLNAVKDYGGHGEKKVHRCTHTYTHLHTCTVYMLSVCVCTCMCTSTCTCKCMYIHFETLVCAALSTSR